MIARAYRPLHDVRRIDGMTREEICRRYQQQILQLARRMYDHAGAMESGLSPGDLVGHGVVGLLEAFDRYEKSFGVDFTTFAEYRIRGSMLDALRTADPSTRRRRQLEQQIDQIRQRILEREGTPPSHEMVAAELGVEMEAYWQLLDNLAPVTLVPIREALSITEEPHAPRQLLAREARDILRNAMDTLPDRERRAVLLYYGRDCSLAEIAVLFEVSPARISQILSTARGRLKAALQLSADVPALIEEGEQ